MVMSTRKAIEALLTTLPDHRLREVLDYARFLAAQQEEWQRLGRAGLSRACGPEEPEYTENDLQREPNLRP